MLKENELISLTKNALMKGVGLEDETILADNFEFCAPFVGPLKREEYLGALRGFDVSDLLAMTSETSF